MSLPGELRFVAPWVDPEEFAGREWLLTNGLGGYSSMTLAGTLTRRYHGLFMPNLAEPKGRHLLVSRLDETIAAGELQALVGGGDLYGDEALRERLRWISEIGAGRNRLVWYFKVGDALIEKRLLMPNPHNKVQLCYRLVQGGSARLTLRPFLPMRRQDAALCTSADAPVEASEHVGGIVRFERPGVPLRVCMLASATARFVPSLQWSVDQLLARERLRGNPCHESASSPGFYEATLSPGRPLLLTISVDESDSLDNDFEASWSAEDQRSDALLQVAGQQQDEFAAALVLAADQFIIRPESRQREQSAAHAAGHALRTVIAGYHWFGDWGRDTMIALEGLMLSTGRHPEARATLLTFAEYVRDGLLPNLFPEGSAAGLYHTVDASLWYFHAVHRYLHHSRDYAILPALLPTLRSIAEHYHSGTRFGIGADPADGLIVARSSQHPLTWMDAHMGDLIVTPRRGKPVEIQALWYNALQLLAGWEGEGSTQSAALLAMAERVQQSFNARFWNASRQCLYDLVDGDDGADLRLRPNQIFALSLDHPVLQPARWGGVLAVVQEQLLTPYGLRTLSSEDPQYRRNYHGSLADRDAAYHQGTVWPWLLGHFVDAWLRVHRDRVGARRLLQAFPEHLRHAGVASISEVFDAEAPHAAHGCIAQAWSVAEVLRAWLRTAEKSGD